MSRSGLHVAHCTIFYSMLMVLMSCGKMVCTSSVQSLGGCQFLHAAQTHTNQQNQQPSTMITMTLAILHYQVLFEPNPYYILSLVSMGLRTNGIMGRNTYLTKLARNVNRDGTHGGMVMVIASLFPGLHFASKRFYT